MVARLTYVNREFIKKISKKAAKLRELTMIATPTTCATNFLPKNRYPIADVPLAERAKTKAERAVREKIDDPWPPGRDNVSASRFFSSPVCWETHTRQLKEWYAPTLVPSLIVNNVSNNEQTQCTYEKSTINGDFENVIAYEKTA